MKLVSKVAKKPPPIGLRPYPAYRNAGLPWLDRIPDAWEVIRAKYLFGPIDVRSTTGDEELLTVSAADGVRRRNEKAVTMFMASSYVGHKLCWPGDLVINSLWAWATGFGFSRYHGIISSAYGVYRLRPEIAEDFEYFHQLLRSRAYDWEFTVRSKGIWVSRLQLTDEAFLEMPILVPPVGDRTAIVRFIRHLDQLVNQLIRAKRKMIELLNEQKQAIIHRAVTRGLDPTVTLKPSGIEWLSDIPAQWTVMALRLRYSVELGKMLDGKRITGNYLIPYLRNTDVQWDNIRTAQLPQMDIRTEEYERYTVRAGDLLVCEGGEVGRSAMWAECDSVVGYQKALHRLRPRCPHADNPRFLMYQLFYVAQKGVFKADGSENTIAHLTSEKLRKYRFAFPGRVEQDDLVKYIDFASQGINLAISKANSEIDLIREYRSRLISDVVTGQVDVRHLDLPDVEELLIEEPEELDIEEFVADPEEQIAGAAQ